ncbi:hypothetical protein HPB48_015844 [Haemaphysalis longicornis]|uniref:NADH dehydrogenase [ubiquinone] 1 beta subcomplex subunit 10 n=1 Tax=Haemaphysalis longicornis TaxID=44386 RepID=A0A9J6FG22_HAELO|nr:hypothetical protein HPB48_015844 [Haemaphysalis longicornis]
MHCSTFPQPGYERKLSSQIEGPSTNWYHRKYRRVPTIDECYSDDLMCKFEANEQYKRDREVDTKIVNLLSQRRDDCMAYEIGSQERCQPIIDQYKEAELNWFIKCEKVAVKRSV